MYLDEVKVDIARDGSYRFVDGRYRLSLAKIAGIDEIPAVVVVRHEQLMDTLRATPTAGSPGHRRTASR